MWGAAETATVFAGVENSLLHFVMSPGQKRYIHNSFNFRFNGSLSTGSLAFSGALCAFFNLNNAIKLAKALSKVGPKVGPCLRSRQRGSICPVVSAQFQTVRLR
jgi:hypothetical protein